MPAYMPLLPAGACRYVAELMAHYVQQAVVDLATNPLSEDDETAAAAQLPPPMFRGNLVAQANACLLDEPFRQATTNVSGWEWVNEGTKEKPKRGWIATKPPAQMSFVVDSNLVRGPHAVAPHPAAVKIDKIANRGVAEQHPPPRERWRLPQQQRLPVCGIGCLRILDSLAAG